MRAFPSRRHFFPSHALAFSVFLDWSRVPRGRFFRFGHTVFCVRKNATTTDFGVPFGFLVDVIFPTPARGFFERLF